MASTCRWQCARERCLRLKSRLGPLRGRRRPSPTQEILLIASAKADASLRKYLQSGDLQSQRKTMTPQVLADDWHAVEIAPRDGSEKWRFVVTAKNSLAIERRTREGSFSVEEIEWIGKTREFTGYRDTEMQIPLSLFADFDGLRFNALRRVTHISGAKILAARVRLMKAMRAKCRCLNVELHSNQRRAHI